MNTGMDLTMANYCFVYTSISKQKWSEDQLKMMLRKSREKNEKQNITGMLLYLDPYFIQILEGEESIITDLFNKIKDDPRHYKVSLIYKKPIAERLFADWRMGFNVLTEENHADMDGFSDFFENPSSNYSHISSEIDQLLKKFRNETLF